MILPRKCHSKILTLSNYMRNIIVVTYDRADLFIDKISREEVGKKRDRSHRVRIGVLARLICEVALIRPCSNVAKTGSERCVCSDDELRRVLPISTNLFGK